MALKFSAFSFACHFFAACGKVAPAGQLSVGRVNGNAVGVQDMLLFAGGYTDTKGRVKSKVVDMYNTTSNEWSVANMSAGRTLFAGTSLGDLAMFGCGETGDSVKTETDTIDVWNATSSAWAVYHLSEARKKCSATSVVLEWETPERKRVKHGKMIFAGGWPLDGHVESARVDIYDYATGTWSLANLSQPRMYMSAASVGEFAIFAGGLKSDGDSDQVDIYNARTGEWSTSSLVRPMREGMAIGTNQHAIFYGAGHTQMFNPQNKSWTVRNTSAEWAKMAAATIGDGRFALFAGGIGCPGNVCATVEVYDENTSKWFTAKQNLTMAREYAMGAGVGNLAVFAGGMNNTHIPSQLADFYSLPEILRLSEDAIEVIV